MATNWKAILLASMIATTTFGARNVFAASVSPEQASFQDIGQVSADQQAAIRQAVSLGLISGYPNGQFKPDEALTRMQLAVLLAKALHLPMDANAGTAFKDVAPGSWSAGYIEAVRAAGLMNGTKAGFDPDRPVTRQELASVFVRAVKGQNTTGGLETDAALVAGASGWAADSVQAALRLGLMTPEGSGFEPRQEVARADIARFLVDIFPEKEQTATVTKVDGDVITVDGTPYLVTDELKRLLLADGNAAALQGAVLQFKSAVRSLNDLSELEIVSAGSAASPVKLDTTGMPAGGTLKISGDHVAINGGAITNLVLQNQAAGVSVDASVDRLELTGQPVTLSGKGVYGEIRITNPKAKLTVGPDVAVTRLVVPDGIALTDMIPNLAQVQKQIGTVISASGASLNVQTAPVYSSAPIVVDRKMLTAAIADASSLADAAVAGAAEGQYPQSAIDALKEAIRTAGDVKANVQATQTEVDNAAASLREAIKAFKVAAVHIVATQLTAAIADASSLADAAVAGAAEGQYPQSAIDALNEANRTAGDVKANVQATQTEVDSAAASLREAINAFKVAVVHIGTSLLNEVIDDASSLADTAVAGAAEGQYPPSAIDALNDAIRAAEGVKSDDQATQAEVDGAAASLLDAIDAFKAAVVHIVTTQLNAAIADASGLADAAMEGAAEGQYSQSAIDALKEAIRTAAEVKADAQMTQAEVNGAAASLFGAIDTFKAAVVHIDATQLTAAIADASGLADAAVAGAVEGQYPLSAIDALKDAIRTAEGVKSDDQATQAEVDGAAASLLGAIDAFKRAVVHIDATQLAAAIADALGLADAAVAGAAEGQYPQSAIDGLNDAITAAIAVIDDAGKDQAAVNGADTALRAAITTFQAAVSHSLSVSLIDNRPFYLNSGRPGTEGDTVLSTNIPGTYNKRNIKDYLQIKRGSTDEDIQFDSTNHVFNVVEGADSVVGTVSVESTSEYVQLTDVDNGINVHPVDDATESTQAALVFHVKEGYQEVSRVTVPIIMDETAPTLSDSAYSNGQFTMTASEPLTANWYSCQVELSPSGDDSDFRALTLNSDFYVSPVDNGIIVTLSDTAKTNYIPQPSSKFRITINGFTDYAGNPLSILKTFDVPQY